MAKLVFIAVGVVSLAACGSRSGLDAHGGDDDTKDGARGVPVYDCPFGFARCGTSDECDTEVASSDDNCGDCGHGLSCAGGVAAWAGGPARYADGHIRRRLRAILLQHWNKPKTIRRKLTGLGAPRALVERGVGTSRGPWKQANMKVVTMGLRNEHFERWGLLSLDKLCAQRLKQGLPLPETIP